MNLPEGWPTEEMVKAAAMFLHERSSISLDRCEWLAELMINAALVVAPTPPAQENENRRCPECGAECMHVSIPNSSWHKCKKCSWESPPAQEDRWHKAVLNECMAIEGCYKESDPAGTIKCLIDWHVMNERYHAPAQEAEPVGYGAKIYGTDKWAYIWHEKDDVQGWINLQHQSQDNITYEGPMPLYTRPADDKLRKAAEKVCKMPQTTIEIMQAVYELRAALEK